jgi:hypothetical protein
MNRRWMRFVAAGLLLAGGVVNGFLLFGGPRPAGLIGNLAFAVVTALLIAGSRPRFTMSP